MKAAVDIASTAENGIKGKMNPYQIRVVQIPKTSGLLPLLTIFIDLSALCALSGDAAGIYTASLHDMNLITDTG